MLLFSVLSLPLLANQSSPGAGAIVGHKDLRLCMTFQEFRAGPDRGFSTHNIHGNPIMPGMMLLARAEDLPAGHAQVSVRFGEGNRLAEIAIRLPPYLPKPQRLRDGVRRFEQLAGELRSAYAIRPTGPILAVESDLFGERGLLLIDPRGNAISLQHSIVDYGQHGVDESVQLAYYARGTPWSPARRAGSLLVGHEIKFCEGE